MAESLKEEDSTPPDVLLYQIVFPVDRDTAVRMAIAAQRYGEPFACAKRKLRARWSRDATYDLDAIRRLDLRNALDEAIQLEADRAPDLK